VAARISVVVPAFNEERYLPRLLESLARARERYRGESRAVETIVADNCSSDRTAEIAQSHGCDVIRVAPRIIGAVRNAGARVARGELLAFVDADTQVHPDTFNAIEAYYAAGDPVVGVCGARPERESLPIALGWSLVGAATAALGYGVPLALEDCMPTGVVCCRREDWIAVGGYREDWLFAEDAAFLFSLAQRGRALNRPWGRIRGAPAIVSTRKFDAFGDWHYVTYPARLARWLIDPQAMRAGVERYWYGARPPGR
jgi:glycosyltransferase involved in cell wall biosynthesis